MGTHLAVVDANDAANHLGNDNHVPEVGLHNCGLLIRGGLLLCLPQLFDEAHWAALQAALEPATSTSVNELPTINEFVELWSE